MSEPSDRQTEETLRQVFARMRDEDQAHVPPFPALQVRSSIGWRLLPAAVTALIVAAAGLSLWLPSGTGPGDDGVLLAEWSAPTTEFLGLDEFGFELVPPADANAADDFGDWTDFPTDMLLQQAAEQLGEEMQ